VTGYSIRIQTNVLKLERRQGPLLEFKQAAYPLDRDSRNAALARFLLQAVGQQGAGTADEGRLAA
jgi:hypothetical protein